MNGVYFLPMLAWISILFMLVHDRIIVVRCLSWGCLVLLPFGLITDFYHPGSKPTRFAESAREFERSPAGIRMLFPVHPLGFQPTMVLTKH